MCCVFICPECIISKALVFDTCTMRWVIIKLLTIGPTNPSVCMVLTIMPQIFSPLGVIWGCEIILSVWTDKNMQIRLTRMIGTSNEAKAFISLDYEKFWSHRKFLFNKPDYFMVIPMQISSRSTGQKREVFHCLKNEIKSSDLDLEILYQFF